MCEWARSWCLRKDVLRYDLLHTWHITRSTCKAQNLEVTLDKQSLGCKPDARDQSPYRGLGLVVGVGTLLAVALVLADGLLGRYHHAAGQQEGLWVLCHQDGHDAIRVPAFGVSDGGREGNRVVLTLGALEVLLPVKLLPDGWQAVAGDDVAEESVLGVH